MKKVKSVEEQKKDWLEINPNKKLTQLEIDQLDNQIRQKISEELNVTGDYNINEFMLLHKWREVQDFCNRTSKKDIEEVYSLIWKPQGRSDYRRIVPELILTSNTLEIKKINFWGEESYQEYVQDEKLIKHWNILRVLISSSRHDGVIGRQLRYLVRDKVTKKYLGIICIASSMMNLSERNKEVFAGDVKLDLKKYEELYVKKILRDQRLQARQNGIEIEEGKQEIPLIDKKEFKNWLDKQETYQSSLKAKKLFKSAFAVGGKSLNMANGQTIMCTQPFGRIFNGGKLLALLCSSKQVADDWKQKYGDVLVTVETTSLYGEKESTQYDGLRPYWINLGKTSGNTPIKPTNELWKSIKKWVLARYPDVYFNFIVEKNHKNQPAVRDKKNGLINKTYTLLGISKESKTVSGHQRGIFISKLYENSYEFLRNEITEKELVPSFDNSVETLTEFWKFGYQGDVKNGTLHMDLVKFANNKNRHNAKNSPAKVRLQGLIDEELKKGKPHYIPLITDWYYPMSFMTWVEAKERFLSQVAR